MAMTMALVDIIAAAGTNGRFRLIPQDLRAALTSSMSATTPNATTIAQ